MHAPSRKVRTPVRPQLRVMSSNFQTVAFHKPLHRDCAAGAQGEPRLTHGNTASYPLPSGDRNAVASMLKHRLGLFVEDHLRGGPDTVRRPGKFARKAGANAGICS